jgi:hypothetical protein
MCFNALISLLGLSCPESRGSDKLWTVVYGIISPVRLHWSFFSMLNTYAYASFCYTLGQL